MLSRGPLQRDILNNLHIYAGSTHKHQGQTPQVLDVASLNRKNTKIN
jgi:large subunit ribosomal protein L13